MKPERPLSMVEKGLFIVLAPSILFLMLTALFPLWWAVGIAIIVCLSAVVWLMWPVAQRGE